MRTLAPSSISPRVAELARITPALVVVGVLIAWSASSGGFPATRWYPGAVALLLVLATALAGARVRWSALSAPVRTAAVALAAYTAWSYASIAWADSQGVAWDGANRTLLYLVVFALVGMVRVTAGGVLAVVGAWTLALIGLAVWVVLALPEPVGQEQILQGPGVSAPTGYTNAQACLWLMAGWSALVLSTSRAVHPALRGAFAGGAVLLADTALLSESRGSLIAAGICAVVLLAIAPTRGRSLLALVLVGAGVAVTAPHVLDVAGDLETDRAAAARLADLTWPILAAAVATALVAGAAALVERSGLVPSGRAPRLRRSIRLPAVVVAIALGTVALATFGDPVERVRDQWTSFKRGTTTVGSGASPLSGGFGGARYDYYRVSLDIFREHPIVGTGADNFAHDYAARGRALEAPSYVHSLELRALVHTGIVGALLLAIALGAALTGAWRAMRTRSAVVATTATAATIGFAQWAIQGSADWFWEIPALGGAAFALLGAACGAAPVAADRQPSRGRLRGWPIAGAALAAAALASLALPWVSAIEVSRATRVWPSAPDAALRQLDVAARLNPLSPEPQLNEGTIAVRIGRTERARAAFADALRRDARDEYATLMLGALASERGDRALARRFLERAVSLNPQDGVAVSARDAVRAGRRVRARDVLAQLQATAQALLR